MENNEFLADQDMTDEMRIQFAIDEFYEFIKTYDGFDNEKITRMKLMRNNIINMMHTYLKKFQNDLIMEEFKSKLINAKNQATKDGFINKYLQFMNEIRVIQEYKGIRENIAEKLADQLFDFFKNSEVIPVGRNTANDTK